MLTFKKYIDLLFIIKYNIHTQIAIKYKNFSLLNSYRVNTHSNSFVPMWEMQKWPRACWSYLFGPFFPTFGRFVKPRRISTDIVFNL